MADGSGITQAGTVGSVFAKVLIIVTVVMFVCLPRGIAMAVFISDPTPTQNTLIEGLSHAFTLCLGALVGLLGGKIADASA